MRLWDWLNLVTAAQKLKFPFGEFLIVNDKSAVKPTFLNFLILSITFFFATHNHVGTNE